jgi:hypothetical protein
MEVFSNSYSRDIEEFVAHLETEIASHRATAPIEDDVTFLIAECRRIDANQQLFPEKNQT